MFYRKVYPRSWHTIKNNAYLLFFGLFASLLGFHEVKILFNLTNNSSDFISTNIESWISIFLTFATAQLSWTDLPDVLALLGLFVVFSVAIILAVSSQGALVNSALKHTKNARNSMAGHFKIGVDKFWPLLGLNVINALIGYFFIGLVIEPLIYFLINTSDWSVYIILGVVTFFILIPLILIISFVTRYGAAYVVIKNQKLSRAFLNSWALFRANWIITVENALLLVIVTSLFFLAMFSAIVFIFTPFLILAFFMSFSVLAFWLVIIIGVCLGIFIFIIGTAFYGAYYNIVWANVFLLLTGTGEKRSKVHRLAHKHFPRLTR